MDIVGSAIGIVNAALAESVGWEELAELVTAQGRAGHPVASRIVKVSFLLCTVIFHANLAHSLTRSP